MFTFYIILLQFSVTQILVHDGQYCSLLNVCHEKEHRWRRYLFIFEFIKRHKFTFPMCTNIYTNKQNMQCRGVLLGPKTFITWFLVRNLRNERIKRLTHAYTLEYIILTQLPASYCSMVRHLVKVQLGDYNQEKWRQTQYPS